MAILTQLPPALTIMISSEVVNSDRERGGEQLTYWSGCVSSTWWFYFTGKSTDEVCDAHVEHWRKMLRSLAPRMSFVCIAHRAESPSPQQCKRMADFIVAESRALSALVGFALVVDSPLHVFALRAVNCIVKKPFPETVCGSPSTAARWLEERGADIDALTLTAALEERVPRQYLGIL
jgi:hypothetical protein